jgi:hypothetical protein
VKYDEYALERILHGMIYGYPIKCPQCKRGDIVFQSKFPDNWNISYNMLNTPASGECPNCRTLVHLNEIELSEYQKVMNQMGDEWHRYKLMWIKPGETEYTVKELEINYSESVDEN